MHGLQTPTCLPWTCDRAQGWADQIYLECNLWVQLNCVETHLKVGLAALIIASTDDSIFDLYPNEMLECKVWIASGILKFVARLGQASAPPPDNKAGLLRTLALLIHLLLHIVGDQLVLSS